MNCGKLQLGGKELQELHQVGSSSKFNVQQHIYLLKFQKWDLGKLKYI